MVWNNKRECAVCAPCGSARWSCEAGLLRVNDSKHKEKDAPGVAVKIRVQRKLVQGTCLESRRKAGAERRKSATGTGTSAKRFQPGGIASIFKALTIHTSWISCDSKRETSLHKLRPFTVSRVLKVAEGRCANQPVKRLNRSNGWPPWSGATHCTNNLPYFPVAVLV